MHLTPLIALLLSTLTLAHPKSSDSGSISVRDDGSLNQCPTTHLPTFSQFKAAIAQYCGKHFSPNKWLVDDEKVVLTYTLRDVRGYPIKWILSVMWDQLNFQPGGKLLVYESDCEEWFNAFMDPGEEGKGWCKTEGLEKKLVLGGKRNGIGEGVVGNKIRVVTRKRKDDYFEPPTEEEEENGR